MVPQASARFLSIRVPSGDRFGVLKALVGEGRRAQLQKRDRVAMDGRDESDIFHGAPLKRGASGRIIT